MERLPRFSIAAPFWSGSDGVAAACWPGAGSIYYGPDYGEAGNLLIDTSTPRALPARTATPSGGRPNGPGRNYGG